MKRVHYRPILDGYGKAVLLDSFGKVSQPVPEIASPIARQAASKP